MLITVDDLYSINGVKRIVFGKEKNINNFYVTELFGLAIDKINENCCLISAIESVNALNVCKIKKGVAYVICQATKVNKSIRELAKKYQISLFTFEGTSVELLYKIFKFQEHKNENID